MKVTPATIAFPDDRHRVKVGDLEDDMFVRVHCKDDSCRHMEEIPAAWFQERYEPETSIVDLAPKFTCRECGKVGTRYWDAWRKTDGTD